MHKCSFHAPETSKKPAFLSIQDIIPPASIKQAATDGVTDGPLFPSLSSPVAQAMEMEAEAERRRRAEVLQSEGDRQSEVNLAQGLQGG